MIVNTVHLNVFFVLFAHLLDRVENDSVAAVLAHRQRRVVGVAAGTVPVARDRFRAKINDDAKVLGHAMQQEARHPQIVAHAQALARTHLELPLTGHHFGVRARDLDAGVETRAIVRLDDRAAKVVVSTNGTVVRTLRCWVRVCRRRPAERTSEFVE